MSALFQTFVVWCQSRTNVASLIGILAAILGVFGITVTEGPVVELIALIAGLVSSILAVYFRLKAKGVFTKDGEYVSDAVVVVREIAENAPELLEAVREIREEARKVKASRESGASHVDR